MAKRATQKTLTKRMTSARTLHVSVPVNIVINPQPRVVPGQAHVWNGQRVVWWNHSRHRVRVQVFDAIMGRPFFLTIEPGGHREAPADIKAPKGGPFPYAVVDLVTGNGIPGNSPPEIVIE